MIALGAVTEISSDAHKANSGVLTSSVANTSLGSLHESAACVGALGERASHEARLAGDPGQAGEKYVEGPSAFALAHYLNHRLAGNTSLGEGLH